MQAVQPLEVPLPPEVQALIEAAMAGRDLATVLLGSGDLRVLRRCAFVRRFNAELFAQILRPAARVDAQAWPFERVIALPGIRPSPGRPGWYSLDTRRREMLQRRWMSPRRIVFFQRLNRRIAAWFKGRGSDGELEVLYHRLACNSAAAEAAWRRDYAAARDRFDLARCTSMLSLPAEVARFVSPALSTFMTQEQGLLQARRAFADDYFRTGRYLERRKVFDDFETLLRDDRHSIMVLHAPGGSGKTMFLRWLAARYCLPRGIPISRIDFDFFDQPEQELAPVFFLAKLAERLNAQIAGGPFHEMLRAVAELRGLVSSRLAEGHSGSSSESARRLEAEITDRFVHTLIERCAGLPVVLVFDTLEEAALRHRVNMHAVVTAIEAVRSRLEEETSPPATPRLILILSGRYSLEEQFGEVEKDFGDRINPCEVAPFDDAESRAYLQRRLTGIATPPNEAVIAGVVQRAGGSPFKLALYADILLATPGIRVEDLGRGVDVDMLYLIERVMKRIADRRIYLLLRYGVLARRLTRNFVENVLGKPMRLVARGDRRADDPAQDAVSHKDWKTLWASMEPLDYDEMWKGLRDFAGASSWVSVDTEIGDSVVIQPVVSHPMRRALLSAERPVVAQIHRAAIRHARSELRNRTRPAAESLAMLTYHDFQLRGAHATPDWERRLREYANDAHALRSLASIVLSEDLRESEAGSAVAREAVRLVPNRVAAHARFVLAQTTFEESERWSAKESQARLLDEARRQLARYDDLVGTAEHPVPPDVEGRLRYALAVDEAAATRGLDQMASGLGGRLSGDHRAGLLLALERGYAQRDPELARSFGVAWGKLAWQRGEAESYAEAVVASIAYRIQQGQRAGAMRECLDRMKELSRTNRRWVDADEATAGRRLVAREQPVLEAWCGLLHAAIVRRGKALETPGADTDDAEELVRTAALHSWAGEAKQAIQLAEQAAQRIKERLRALRLKPHAERKLTALRLEGLATRAHASRRLMEFGAALDLHQEAMELYAQRSDHQSEVLARLQKARVYLLDIGHLGQAAEHLIDSDDALADEVARVRIEHTLLRAVLHDRRGDPATALQLLHRAEALRPELRHNAINWRVELAVAALALHVPDDRVPFLDALHEALKTLDCSGARLTLLRGLRYCAPVAGVSKATAKALDVLTRVKPLDLPGYMRLHPGDRLRFTLLRAELLRIVGLGDKAADELRALRLRQAEEAPAELWHRDLALACDRLGIDPGEALPQRWLIAFVAKFRPHRTLCAAVQVDQARRDIAAGLTRRALQLLRSAQRALDRPDVPRSELDIRALTLQARLARSGADAWGEASPVELLDRARRIRTELGLPEGDEDAAQAEVSTAPSSRVPLLDGGDERLTFGLRFERPDSVTLFDFTPSRIARNLIDYTVRSPINGLLAEFASGRFGEGAAHEATALGVEAGMRFGRLMAESVLPPSLRDVPVLDLVLECVQPGMQALPWELMVHVPNGQLPLSMDPRVRDFWRAPYRATPRDRVAWAQRALSRLMGAKVVPDGLHGPATAAALGRFQAAEGLPADGRLDRATLVRLQARMAQQQAPQGLRATHVLLITPHADVQVAAQRGLSASGTDLAQLYLQHGLKCDVLEVPDPSRLREMLGAHPSVIHIAAPISQSRSSRELGLQFAAGYEDLGSQGFGASPLARFIAERPPEAGMPLVIVDTPRPYSRDETFRQLLLRNAFAAQLFAYGPLPTVIATGLGMPGEQRVLSERLTRGIAEGLVPGKLVRQLRSVADADGGDPWLPVASAGIALFAVDPAFDPLLAGVPR
ncbi:peptidoglycan-binding domain-containing protein [Variovorax ureilyticus]|uniref:Peptidoglycan-binding domain-containing protein n=1 Tax=Variovorax ureilyticus TaxID=1836198 RepID=A0ABU8VE25_9BURK